MGTEAPDGAFYDIMSFMLVTLFDLQLEEEEEARADTDKTATDEVHEGITGKNQEIANAIRAATDTHLYTKKNLGLTLREIHLDQWSITEILRLHMESSGAYRGNNLRNWRYQQRGGWVLQDDPGFQFCMENPQILASLHEKSIFDLGVTEENKRLRELKQEEWNRVKEERQKVMEERLKEAENKKNEKEKKLVEDEKKEVIETKKEEEAPAPRPTRQQEAALTLTARQQEAALAAKEKEDQDKLMEEENLKSDWVVREA